MALTVPSNMLKEPKVLKFSALVVKRRWVFNLVKIEAVGCDRGLGCPPIECVEYVLELLEVIAGRGLIALQVQLSTDEIAHHVMEKAGAADVEL